jgi:hypothetical protein
MASEEHFVPLTAVLSITQTNQNTSQPMRADAKALSHSQGIGARMGSPWLSLAL